MAVDIRHLRAFVAVAEELHFSRAAARLHMAQPPLSQLILGLERSLGSQLLERTTRSVSLTASGQLLLERARHILSTMEDMVIDVARAERGEIGSVRLGFTDLCTVDLLPRLALHFQARHPNLNLDLLGSFSSHEEIDMLLMRDLDAALVHGPVNHPALSSRLVRTDDLVVVLPRSHRLADRRDIDFAELAGEPFVTYPSGHGSTIREAIVSHCATAGFRPHIVREAPESLAIVALSAAGVGVAILPSSMTPFHPPWCVYRPLRGDGHTLALKLAWRTGDRSPTLARLLEVTDDVVAELAGGDATPDHHAIEECEAGARVS